CDAIAIGTNSALQILGRPFVSCPLPTLPGCRSFFELAVPGVAVLLTAAAGMVLAAAGLWLVDERFVPTPPRPTRVRRSPRGGSAPDRMPRATRAPTIAAPKPKGGRHEEDPHRDRSLGLGSN